jgi:hypothetical protein
MTTIATCDLALLAVAHNFTLSPEKGRIMRSFQEKSGERSMVDALDDVNLDALAREIAKARMRRAEAIVNGARDGWVATGEFLLLVKHGVLDVARQLRTAVARRA